jgi:hypothetical protein
MVQSRRNRRNPFIRRIQRHTRVSALDAGNLVQTGPATTPSPKRAALGVAGDAVPIELQQGLGRGRLPVALALSTTSIPRSTSTTQQAWNKIGRTPVPVVVASLAPTPAPWEGGDEWFVEEPVAAAAGGEESQAAEMGLEQPEQVQQSQVGRLPSSGFADQPHAEMGTLSRSAQKSPELAVHKPAQSAAFPVKPQEEARSSERGSVEKQADTGSLSSQEDGVWKRLQTIFRKHEEKRHEVEASAETQSNRTAVGEGVAEHGDEEREKKEDGAPRLAAEVPEQAAASDAGMSGLALSTAGITSIPGTQEPWKGDVPGESETAGESTPESQFAGQSTSKEKLTPSEPGVVGDKTDLARLQGLEKETVPGKTIEVLPSRPPVMTKPEPRETLAARTESPKTPVSIPLADAAERIIEGISSDESVPGDSIVKKPFEPQPQELPSQAPRIDDQKSQAIQPLPLEDVWPVQRQTSPLMQEGEQAAFVDGAQDADDEHIGDDVHIKTFENTAASLEILGQQEHTQVREALREVSPGKPTDSSVEVITPRRQRPAREKALGIEPAEKAAPGVHSQTTSKSELEAIATAPGKEIPGKDIENASAGILMASEEVETEIGPLPVDLWELIGESPQAAQPQSSQTASPATSGKPVQRESFSPQNGKKMPEAPTGFVQRQPAEPGAAGDQPVAAAAAESQASQPQAEIDMDELARRVYGEVKKRLALEWERMRRRL